MQPFQRILVPLADEESDAGLLEYAGMLAGWSEGAEFDCVHVTADAAAREELLARIETATRRHLTGAAGSALVRCHVVVGHLVDALLECAATLGADLILLGHRRSRSGRRSLARRLAMSAPCSVWMVPEGSPASLRSMLAPIDFSRRAADALITATALAAPAGLDEIQALHVYFNTAAVSFDEYEEMEVEKIEQAFCLFIAPIDLHGVHVRPRFVESPDVAPAILQAASEQGAGLIVMGTRGRSRSAAILLGSETEQIIMETSIPILAVKHRGARLRLLEALLDRRLRARHDQRFT